MAEVLVKLHVPNDWRRFRLPRALDARLQELLDRQDRDGKLSASERREAKALAELADMLSLMKLRAEEAAKPDRSAKRREGTMAAKTAKTANRSSLPRPRESELGKTLRDIRQRYIAAGGKLLSIEELDREVAERRGERSN
jgi:hypothetical protein